MRDILKITILSLTFSPLISFSLEPVQGGKLNLELIAKIKQENLLIAEKEKARKNPTRLPASSKNIKK